MNNVFNSKMSRPDNVLADVLPSGSPVLKLPLKVDVEKLNSVFEKKGVFEKIGTDDGTVSLVNSNKGLDPWRDGTTLKVLAQDEEFQFSEGDYVHVNEPLKGSYFENIFKMLRGFSRERTGRVRLFRREVQTSSSLHRDLDVRFHLALKSTENAFLVFPDKGVFHIPVDGHFYLVDTTVPHFAVNTDSSRERVHMIVSTWCGFREVRGNDDQIVQAARQLFNDFATLHGGASC